MTPYGRLHVPAGDLREVLDVVVVQLDMKMKAFGNWDQDSMLASPLLKFAASQARSHDLPARTCEAGAPMRRRY
jgi:hypothetical protein